MSMVPPDSQMSTLHPVSCAYAVLVHPPIWRRWYQGQTDHQPRVWELLALKFRLGEIPPPVIHKMGDNDASAKITLELLWGLTS